MADAINFPKQTRRAFLTRGTGALAGISLASLTPLPATQGSLGPQAHPNFVFFLGEGVRADELSSRSTEGRDSDGLSVMCNKLISTPHLDRIVTEGVTFRNAFVVNALCLPSRATILTGLYSHTSGAVDNGPTEGIPDYVPTVADLLRRAGYDIAFFGKAHVHDLSKRNWDLYFGIEAAEGNYYHPVITESRGGIVSPPQRLEGYFDDLVADRAIEWLNQKRDKPFCLFFWFMAPHAPFYRARRYADLYNGIKIPKPKTFDDGLKDYPGKPRAFTRGMTHIVTGIYGNDDPRSLEELVKDHCAGVVSNDDNAGRIMAALEKLNILDETAIVLSSDHGFFLGEWGFYNKMFMHEPSIRVPLAVRYPPLIRARTASDQMALNLDVAPTMLELAGLRAPEWMQGNSLVPLLKGVAPSNWRKDWLYEYYDDRFAPKSRGIRTERYKLIEYWEEIPKEFELYDLKSDPGELHNLYGNPQYDRLAAQLQDRMRQLRVETGDDVLRCDRTP
jgi:arylsulfatase A-like enzyme